MQLQKVLMAMDDYAKEIDSDRSINNEVAKLGADQISVGLMSLIGQHYSEIYKELMKRGIPK